MSETTDWNKLTIPQLKDQLKKRGLDQSGKKADLVSRLLASDQAHGEDLGSGKSLGDPSSEYEAKEDDQLDSSENPDDSRASEHHNTEPDFTENITFEDLESSTANESGQLTATDFEAGASRQEGSTETKEGGGRDGEGPAEEGKGGGEEAEGGGAEGEGKTAGEGTEDGKEPVEELPDVTSQFFVDIPRDRDCFNLTWNGKKFVVPFRLEVNSDLLPTYKAQSLSVCPVQLADIDTDLFKRLFQNATKFSIDFNESKSGQVKFLFKSAEEAEKAKEELKAFRETFSTEPLDFEFKEYEDDFVPVNKKTEQVANTGSLVHRLLFVGNLPSDVTEAALAELIPGALRVILPHKENEGNAENLQQTRHAYVEFSSDEDAVSALEKYKELTLNDEKLFVIKAIPVRKDRFGLLSDSLRQIFLDKIRKLQNIIKTPYNKSQQDLDEIQKSIDQTKEKLAADTKHRLGWGMLLGRLDECVLDREDSKYFDNQRGRGGRGGRGQPRGGNSFYDGQGARRGMFGVGGSPRGSYGYGGSGMGYGGRGGWNSGYGGGYQSYYGGGGSAYSSPSYGGGYNQFAGKRRGSYDNYGGEWKRGRGGGGSYY